ncbi:MAG: hypothetical protein M3Y57_20180, partial [Acidobacteriota bacterium]|nr:hypothetical protein [Acidobacteriota bacterium]
ERKVFETQPVEASHGWNNSLKTVPLKFSLNLDNLPPGKYVCQVSVLDPTVGKAAFWRSPIAILP